MFLRRVLITSKEARLRSNVIWPLSTFIRLANFSFSMYLCMLLWLKGYSADISGLYNRTKQAKFEISKAFFGVKTRQKVNRAKIAPQIKWFILSKFSAKASLQKWVILVF